MGVLVYGLSVFLNGPLADKIGGKRAILIGSAGAALFNLLFGFTHLYRQARGGHEGRAPSSTPAHVRAPA